jgi:hypothetical protein
MLSKVNRNSPSFEKGGAQTETNQLLGEEPIYFPGDSVTTSKKGGQDPRAGLLQNSPLDSFETKPNSGNNSSDETSAMFDIKKSKP